MNVVLEEGREEEGSSMTEARRRTLEKTLKKRLIKNWKDIYKPEAEVMAGRQDTQGVERI